MKRWKKMMAFCLTFVMAFAMAGISASAANGPNEQKTSMAFLVIDDGTANLKFLVTLCPRGFKQSEPYIKNVNDAKVTEKEGVTFFTLADEEITGSPTQEFHIVDVYPGAKLTLDTPKSDVIAYMYNGQCVATVDGEKLEMNRQEDAVVIPMGTKWEIENVSKQCVRFALSLSPCR